MLVRRDLWVLRKRRGMVLVRGDLLVPQQRRATVYASDHVAQLTAMTNDPTDASVNVEHCGVTLSE